MFDLDGFFGGIGDWFGGIGDTIGGWFDSGWDSLFGPSFETSFDLTRDQALNIGSQPMLDGFAPSYEDIGFSGPLYTPEDGFGYPIIKGANAVGANPKIDLPNPAKAAQSSLWGSASKAIGAAARAYTSGSGSGSGSGATNTILASASRPNLPTTPLMQPRPAGGGGGPAATVGADSVAAWTRIFMGEK